MNTDPSAHVAKLREGIQWNEDLENSKSQEAWIVLNNS